jgi:hypothetical protein
VYFGALAGGQLLAACWQSDIVSCTAAFSARNYYMTIEPCYTRIEFGNVNYIFVSRERLSEEEGTKLCAYYGRNQKNVLVGQALLVDLRYKEPRFKSVPLDYKLP